MQHSSVTYDPFSSLSIPIPERRSTHHVYVIPHAGGLRTLYCVRLPDHGNGRDVTMATVHRLLLEISGALVTIGFPISTCDMQLGENDG
jgi:hypothetical protein